MKIDILGIKIDKITLFEAKKLLFDRIAKKESFFVVTPNSEFVLEAQNDPSRRERAEAGAEFKNTLNNADLVIPDGQGLIWASKILEKNPGITERVTGADLVEQLLTEAGQRGWKVGIVGARHGNKSDIDMVIKELADKFPIPNSQFQILAEELTSDWYSRNFDLILACHGMKKQEKWIVENRNKIKASVFMGIGGSLDFLSGFTKRAPDWVRKLGFEWLWRLIQRPRHIKRVWRAVEFGIKVIEEKIRISKSEIRNKS